MNRLDFQHAIMNSRNKRLFLKFKLNMAKNSLSQPSGFLNQLYLKKKLMNQFDFRHLVIDSRNKS